LVTPTQSRMSRGAKMEGVQRLRRWYRAGHAHGALAVLRVCQLPSISHVARCQVPSTARAPLEAFATIVLATLGDFVDDEPALSKEQIILATLLTLFGGLGFQHLMAYLHFLPYAASVVLALAVLRERGIDLDSERVTEATPIITLGGKNISGAPGVMILRGLSASSRNCQSARMSARFHESRIAQLTRQLVERRSCPQHDVWLHVILEHSTQLSGAWLSTIPREYISLLPKTAIDIGIRSRLLMTPYKCGSPMGLCGCGTQVVRDAPFRDIVGGSGAEALRFVRAPEEDQAAAAAATGFVAGGIAAAGLQSESAHYARCRLGSSARTRRSYECVRSIIRAFRADGAVVSDEDFTTVHTDSRRSDWYVYSYGDGAAAGRPQGHFDFECTTLNNVLPAGRTWSWKQLSWTGATIQSDEDHKGF
jgi:hypothetical protein